MDIDLSSQSGWALNTELTYKMGSVGHPECGVSNYPAGNTISPGEVVIH